jgi:small subunit ribosomal protein S2
MLTVSMKQLLEAGVHFGHQTRRWNPKMAPYIFGARNGIHIIDLQKTVKKLKEAYQFVKEISVAGESVIFIGTKKQAQDSIREEAERCGMHYVNYRWLGGMLTNFSTIKKSIGYLKDLERLTPEELQKRSKKEQAILNKEKQKLERTLGGIKNLPKLPGAIFVIDTKKEHIAIQEARKLGVPVIAVVDTNCDPDEVDLVIPGNDDAIRAVKLITSVISTAIMDGRSQELEGKEIGKSETSSTTIVDATFGTGSDLEKPIILDEEVNQEFLKERSSEEPELLVSSVEHLAGDAQTVAAFADELADEKVERIRTKRLRDE